MLCALCAVVIPDSGEPLCRHHHDTKPDEWAIGNRVMGDFIHRRILHPELAEPERESSIVVFADPGAF